MTKTEKTAVEISKVEIKIGKQVISLTPAEFQELRNVIDAAFPRGNTTYVAPSIPIIIEKEKTPDPWPVPYKRPWWNDHPYRYYWEQPFVTWENTLTIEHSGVAT